MDLDAYFSRIGYTGPRTPTLATLRGIQLAHVMSVPFENLDVLQGKRIVLDLPTLEAKIVGARRGGYCFEQNTLLREVLRTLGFRVTAYLARVRWQVPADVKTALTHMVLEVEAEGRPWLMDVGFGSIGATAPLALDTQEEQTTPHEPRRLVREDGIVAHQVRLGSTWHDVYRFRLEEPAPMDFEMGNIFSCTHPQAHFVRNLIATRVRPEGRVVLFNREFTRRDWTGRADTQPIDTQEKLRPLLAEHFDLHPPPGRQFNFLWQAPAG